MEAERYLTCSDMEVLGRLAEKIMRTEDKYGVGSMLADVLISSTILPRGTHKEDCVAMYANVRYSRVGRLDEQNVIIVSPFEVDRYLVFVSVLSPIGLALIGKAVHSTVKVNMPLGYVEHLQILGVEHFRKGIAHA